MFTSLRFRSLLVGALLLAGPIAISALRAAPSLGDDAAYAKTIHDRAGKIVEKLGISDAAKASRVQGLIAEQYKALRPHHEAISAAKQAVKSATPETKAAAEASLKSVTAEHDARIAELHQRYVAALSAELTPTQVDGVKDGMTYGVLPLTYGTYLRMLPNLTTEQKAQLLAWLTEAREHAMDAGTSDEKHGWFGKYKGKINNYLGKAGIDMKQAEKEFLAREKAAKTQH